MSQQPVDPDHGSAEAWQAPSAPAITQPGAADDGRGVFAADRGWSSLPTRPRGTRDCAGLATALLVLSGLVVVGDVLGALTSFSAVDAYDRAVAEGRDPAEVITLHDATWFFSGLPLLPAWIVGGLWLERVRDNAEAVDPDGLRHRRAWSFLGWVVPIVSLWIPKHVVDDSWRATARATGDRPDSTAWWWTAWIGYWLVWQVAELPVAHGRGAHQGVVPLVEVAAATVAVLAFVLWVRVVRGVTEVQSRLVGRTG